MPLNLFDMETIDAFNKSITDIIGELKSLADRPAKDEKSPATFEIALVLAGAISAGAYTAGVVEFLFEALENWENSKKSSPGSVPAHEVKIKVLSGASAGGMTAAILAAMFHRRATGQPYQRLAEDAWVKKIDIRHLLESSDLDNGDKLRSLLDSSIIEKISKDVILNQVVPGKYTNLPSYLHKKLKLYLTLTNLRGVPFEFNLEGEAGFKFGMSQHADYLYTEVSENSEIEDWEEIRASAVATGAFPIALEPRKITRSNRYYSDRLAHANDPLADFLKLDNSNEEFSFISVDGGVLNNEPLELARRALYTTNRRQEQAEILLEQGLVEINRRRNTGTDAKTCAKDTSELVKAYASCNINKAIILIDPFPNTLEPGRNPLDKDFSIANVGGKIVAAMRKQALFNPKDMLFAGHKDNFNRWVIAPVRYKGDVKIREKAIACGSLDGFGGFFSPTFRQHDYELGKRNCQKFLQSYFVLPEAEFQGNSVVKAQSTPMQKSFTVKAPGGKTYVPIIPLCGDSAKTVAQPVWPELDLKAMDQVNKQLKVRVKRLSALLSGNLKRPLEAAPVMALASLGLAIFWAYLQTRAITPGTADAIAAFWPYGAHTVASIFLTNTLVYFLLLFLVAMAVVPWFLRRQVCRKIYKGLKGSMTDYFK